MSALVLWCIVLHSHRLFLAPQLVMISSERCEIIYRTVHLRGLGASPSLPYRPGGNPGANGTLHPSCTLHPAPCTMHPTLCTLHPAPYTPGLRASPSRPQSNPQREGQIEKKSEVGDLPRLSSGGRPATRGGELEEVLEERHLLEYLLEFTSSSSSWGTFHLNAPGPVNGIPVLVRFS